MAKADRYAVVHITEGREFSHVQVELCEVDGRGDPTFPDHSDVVGIVMSAQMDGNTPRPYGDTLGLVLGSTNHPRPARQCLALAKNLERIVKGVEKIEGTFGSPLSFGQYVAYCLKAAGVKALYERGRRAMAGEWVSHAPDMFAYIVDTRARECLAKLGHEV